MCFIFIYLHRGIYYFSVRTRCVNLIPNCICERMNGCYGKQHFSARKFIRFVFIGVGFFIYFIWFELPEQYDLFVKKKYFQDAFSSFSVYTQNFYCCCCCCSFSVSVIHNPHDMFSPNFKILNYEHGIRMERNEINIFEK